jgi:hypothetical protein
MFSCSLLGFCVISLKKMYHHVIKVLGEMFNFEE